VDSTQTFRNVFAEISGTNNGKVDNVSEPGQKPQYQVILDIQHFRPDEITATGRFSLNEKSEPSTIIIQGKHEGKVDPAHNGIVSRHFTRKYKVPSNVQLDQIQCNMSSDGILQIVLPEIPPKGALAAQPSNKDESFVDKMKHHLVDPVLHVLPDFYLVPFWHRFTDKKPSMGIQSEDPTLFKILVNVKDFTPDELFVESSEYMVRIKGKHEDKRDLYGSLSRSFSRIYDLPKNVQAEDITCVLQAGEILEISAPRGVEAPPMLTVPLTVSTEAKTEIDEKARRQKDMDSDLGLWLMSQI
jgi:HSP20 family molecular chaperone IbpA